MASNEKDADQIQIIQAFSLIFKTNFLSKRQSLFVSNRKKATLETKHARRNYIDQSESSVGRPNAKTEGPHEADWLKLGAKQARNSNWPNCEVKGKAYNFGRVLEMELWNGFESHLYLVRPKWFKIYHYLFLQKERPLGNLYTFHGPNCIQHY